jgi:hypothetical protein
MYPLSEQKNITTPILLSEEEKISGVRVVGHYPRGISCTDCYMCNKFPCFKCKDMDEIKVTTMSWLEFTNNGIFSNYINPPMSYQEYCDIYNDLPDLIAYIPECDDYNDCPDLISRIS